MERASFSFGRVGIGRVERASSLTVADTLPARPAGVNGLVSPDR
jgi:hypothetical protein